ncbi:MAG: type II secretion system major pseudopilin GspG [Pikeienuella sp.]
MPDAPSPTRPERLPRDAGLTLLELLVVITILTLLAVAIGTVALNYLGGARADAARLQMDQIATGLDLYRLDQGRYPTQAEGLEALITRPAGVETWKGPYLRKPEALTDPWGEPFAYEVPGPDGAPYALLTFGADKAPGGADDAADLRL